MMGSLQKKWRILRWISLDVDKLGLDNNDRTLLLTLIQKFSGGPVGLETLAASIGEDAGTLEDVYEPYLLMNGLINRTPRGRMATELAYRHLDWEKENDAMSDKNYTQVLIDGNIYTLGGAEDQEYMQKVASYINEKISGLKAQPGLPDRIRIIRK